MVDVRMPDGAVVRFPDDMPREQVRDMIATKFPQLAQQQQAQATTAPVPMPLPSFRQGSQTIMPPMPRPRPMLGMGPGGNQRTYEIQAPDGRKITIRATDEQTANRRDGVHRMLTPVTLNEVLPRAMAILTLGFSAASSYDVDQVKLAVRERAGKRPDRFFMDDVTERGRRDDITGES
jgi:hypothetical protein